MPTRDVPCRYYTSGGGCRRGDSCHFLHIDNAPTPQSSRRRPTSPEWHGAKQDWRPRTSERDHSETARPRSRHEARRDDDEHYRREREANHAAREEHYRPWSARADRERRSSPARSEASHGGAKDGGKDWVGERGNAWTRGRGAFRGGGNGGNGRGGWQGSAERGKGEEKGWPEREGPERHAGVHSNGSSRTQGQTSGETYNTASREAAKLSTSSLHPPSAGNSDRFNARSSSALEKRVLPESERQKPEKPGTEIVTSTSEHATAFEAANKPARNLRTTHPTAIKTEPGLEENPLEDMGVAPPPTPAEKQKDIKVEDEEMRTPMMDRRMSWTKIPVQQGNSRPPSRVSHTGDKTVDADGDVVMHGSHSTTPVTGSTPNISRAPTPSHGSKTNSRPAPPAKKARKDGPSPSNKHMHLIAAYVPFISYTAPPHQHLTITDPAMLPTLHKSHPITLSLTFAPTFPLRDAHLRTLSASPLCLHLKALQLGDARTGSGAALSDDAVITLVQSVPNLRILRINSGVYLTDRAFLAAVQTCVHLEVLRVAGNDVAAVGLTANAVRQMVLFEGLGRKLRVLEWVFAEKVESKEWLGLSRRRPGLEIRFLGGVETRCWGGRWWRAVDGEGKEWKEYRGSEK